MITRILLVVCIVAMFTSCSSSGKVANDAKSDKLVFGSGGGFTGIYVSIEILRDGRVFNILPDKSQSKVKKLRKKQTREIFAQADSLNLNHLAFNHPGNMSYFINYKFDGDSTEYKWGDSNFSVPIEIKDFYNQLNTIIK